jgi:hypothetical protein
MGRNKETSWFNPWQRQGGFSLLQSIQTGSGTQPNYSTVMDVTSNKDAGVRLTTHLHIVKGKVLT